MKSYEIVDLTGELFGKLTVLKKHGMDANGKNSTWLCVCECGKQVVRARPNLRREGLHCCGCSFQKRIKELFVKHGCTESNTYRSWTDMKTRCLNPKSNRYKNYGGRGIKICERWISSFENFIEDIGHSSSGMSLDRIDPEKNYCKENCRWIPKANQSKNRTCNVYVTFNDIKITAMEFWIRTGKKFSYPTTLKYIKTGKQWKLYP